MFNEWNKTHTDFPKDKCVHELFEQQAARTPDSIVAYCKGRSLTYTELNSKSNKSNWIVKSERVN